MSTAPIVAGIPRPQLFSSYAPLKGTFDELFSGPGAARANVGPALAALLAAHPEELARAQTLAERSLLNQGVTFSVYDDQRGAEKIFPFCLVPRVVAGADSERRHA